MDRTKSQSPEKDHLTRCLVYPIWTENSSRRKKQHPLLIQLIATKNPPQHLSHIIIDPRLKQGQNILSAVSPPSLIGFPIAIAPEQSSPTLPTRW